MTRDERQGTRREEGPGGYPDRRRDVRRAALRDLQRAPGIGPRIADDLWGLGVHSPGELAQSDPEKLYARFCEQTGAHVDRCVLYVFRCAVSWAAGRSDDPELLKWWNWKDRR